MRNEIQTKEVCAAKFCVRDNGIQSKESEVQNQITGDKIEKEDILVRDCAVMTHFPIADNAHNASAEELIKEIQALKDDSKKCHRELDRWKSNCRKYKASYLIVADHNRVLVRENSTQKWELAYLQQRIQRQQERYDELERNYDILQDNYKTLSGLFNRLPPPDKRLEEKYEMLRNDYEKINNDRISLMDKINQLTEQLTCYLSDTPFQTQGSTGREPTDGVIWADNHQNIIDGLSDKTQMPHIKERYSQSLKKCKPQPYAIREISGQFGRLPPGSDGDDEDSYSNFPCSDVTADGDSRTEMFRATSSNKTSGPKSTRPFARHRKNKHKLPSVPAWLSQLKNNKVHPGDEDD
eukprot:XP_014782146.1 PREDICTED: uncharacterized protein LOC106877702 [Octopus bimaculoides]